MNLLLIDNYDSFTNNIVHYIKLADPSINLHVVKNDEFDLFNRSSYHQYDAFVISPGPGNPHIARDLGVCRRLLLEEQRPILGVCLGHQAMAHIGGASVTKANFPVHGRCWQIHHDNSALFADVPQYFQATRYHSWIVKTPLPPELICTAQSDGLVMAIEHKEKPWWGVQFHPESIGTDFGLQIVKNYTNLVQSTSSSTIHLDQSASDRKPKPILEPVLKQMYWQQMDFIIDPIAMVDHVIKSGAPEPMLLESSMVETGLSRFSYLAMPTDKDFSISYDQSLNQITINKNQSPIKQFECSIFDYLDSFQAPIQFPNGQPPFDFHGGVIGWLNYELKSLCTGLPSNTDTKSVAQYRSVHHFFVIDHQLQSCFAAVCLDVDDLHSAATAEALLKQMINEADAIQLRKPLAVAPQHYVDKVDFYPRHSDAAYKQLIRKCKDLIVEGESYELCLTNMIHANLDIDAWQLYKVLRNSNSSTYGAYIKMDDVAVVSSSPERFLSIRSNGRIEAKPIKGTIRRGATAEEDERLKLVLENSEKDLAENLMIVDLLRHDLSSVSEVGSVLVPKLATIESYPAVHQMVSTIEAKLLPEASVGETIKACFPGGSMTGAPKIRSMELLEQLESGSRGIYSGALGWIGFDGQADLSIVIRTAVVSNGEIKVGCGGAITIMSDVDAELDEMKLKSSALLCAIAQTVTGQTDAYQFHTNNKACDDSNAIQAQDDI